MIAELDRATCVELRATQTDRARAGGRGPQTVSRQEVAFVGAMSGSGSFLLARELHVRHQP